MMSRRMKSACLLSFFFSLALLSGMLLPATTAVIHCDEAERRALLELKQRLNDPSNRLSSWVGKDCCAWTGIGCNNITARVIKLDLRNEYNYSDYDDWDKFALHGDISTASSLQSLQDLTYLDLSGNDFSGHTIPEFLGSFARLTYLNLSWASFTGRVPEQLGNLSTLRLLDLSYGSYFLNYYGDQDSTSYLYLENPGWIARLTSLRHLNMVAVSFRSASNWFQALNALPHIQDIELAYCDLGSFPHSAPHLNFTSLRTLNLAGNHISSTEPMWLYNITTIQSLNFGWNDIHWSSMHDSISKLAYIRALDLSENLISKNFLLSLSNLCKLQIIFLKSMPNKDDLYNLEMVFSGCLMYNLEELVLRDNKLSGFFPDWLGSMKNLRYIDLSLNFLHGSLPVSLGSLTSLQYLNLRKNNLNGTVGESIGQLKNLIYLDLSYNSLSLSVIHLANLSSLKYLDISNNSLFMNESDDWIPTFQLQILYMDFCKIEPKSRFPKWLRTQTILSLLSFTNARIQDTIPNWFPSSLQYLDIANNKIGGELTHVFPNLIILDLSYNSFSEHLPLQMANMMPRLKELDLSNNYFTGELSQNFTHLRFLDFSNNLFSGHLPLQMGNIMPSLVFLDLSNNNFTGEVPQNFTNLQLLDLSNNFFSGHLNPTINNTLSNLRSLYLSMNEFTGSIPHSLCHMNSLSSLRLSKNNFIGELPNCWNSSSDATIFDCSNNQIRGEIPNTICNLRMVHSLHLSYNHLSGRIPLCLQDCSSLVLLDVGHNNFTGNIPSWSRKSLPFLRSLSLRFNSLTRNIPELSHHECLQILDVSNNNLSGSIPPTFGNFNGLKGLRNCDTNVYFDISDELWILIKGIENEYGSLLTLIKTIDLSNNGLSGYIPIELGNLHGLQNLNLSGNNLIGEIPKSINGMQNLEVLDLSRNSLSGIIPSSLANLNFLDNLNLSYNNLSGRTSRPNSTLFSIYFLSNTACPTLCCCSQ